LGILKPLSPASPVNLTRAEDDEGVVRAEISNFSILVRQYEGESYKNEKRKLNEANLFPDGIGIKSPLAYPVRKPNPSAISLA
jgi:hypothetical protein